MPGASDCFTVRRIIQCRTLVPFYLYTATLSEKGTSNLMREVTYVRGGGEGGAPSQCTPCDVYPFTYERACVHAHTYAHTHTRTHAHTHTRTHAHTHTRTHIHVSFLSQLCGLFLFRCPSEQSASNHRRLSQLFVSIPVISMSRLHVCL